MGKHVLAPVGVDLPGLLSSVKAVAYALAAARHTSVGNPLSEIRRTL